MKEHYNLSGIYFRQMNSHTGRYENVCFEDLESSTQSRIVSAENLRFLKGICDAMRDTIRKLEKALTADDPFRSFEDYAGIRNYELAWARNPYRCLKIYSDGLHSIFGESLGFRPAPEDVITMEDMS